MYIVYSYIVSRTSSLERRETNVTLSTVPFAVRLDTEYSQRAQNLSAYGCTPLPGSRVLLVLLVSGVSLVVVQGAALACVGHACERESSVESVSLSHVYPYSDTGHALRFLNLHRTIIHSTLLLDDAHTIPFLTLKLPV